MRAVVAAIAAILAAMTTFAWRLVKRAGQMVMELVTVPAPPRPAMQSVSADEPSRADEYEPVRRLASVFAAGEVPDEAQLIGVPKLTVRWLKALDRASLCRVACASDDVLRAHIQGRLRIKGMMPADADSVGAMEGANRPKPAFERKRPTLRELAEAKQTALAA